MGEANTTYAKYFIGESFLNPLTDPKSGLFAANVTFEPGCRKLAYSSFDKRWRTTSSLHRW